MPSVEKVKEILSGVKDPKTGHDIVFLGMVKSLEVGDSRIKFTLALPEINYPAKQDLNFLCTSLLNEAYPDCEVHIHMSASETTAKTHQSAGVKNIIAVASGKGGVGKSTVAVNLALGLKDMGLKVGLIDGDLYGPSIPGMLGLQDQKPKVEKLYGEPKLVPVEYNGIHVISIGFMIEPEQAVVLRGPRLSGVIKQFFNDCLWPQLDYLIIDLPPSTGDIQLTLVQTVSVTGALIVTTPQRVAVADAVKALNMFRMDNVNVPILGVIENMSWFTPEAHPDEKYKIFGEGGGQKLADFGKTNLLAQIPLVQGIRESGDSGKPAIETQHESVKDQFAVLAKNVHKAVEERNVDLPGTTKVVVN